MTGKEIIGLICLLDSKTISKENIDKLIQVLYDKKVKDFPVKLAKPIPIKRLF